MGKLRSIGGFANFSNSQITDLGNLTRICGNLDLRKSKITDLGKLQYVGGEVFVDKNTPKSILDRLIKDKNGKYHFYLVKVNEKSNEEETEI